MTALLNVPEPKSESGSTRRVGVEIEFGGLALEPAAKILKDWLGHAHNIQMQHKGRYEYAFSGDPAGDWVIELDFALLKRMGRSLPENSVLEAAEKSLAWLSESVVPVEIVSPPLSLDKLPALEQLISDLRSAGAEGSSQKLSYAFGLQLNPELPQLTAECILRYLQSFLCLYDWLFERIDPDISRRLSKYIEPFDRTYIQRITTPDYQPDMDTLIDDYLVDNPTRNRPLDLLPLFSHIDEERVKAVVDDPLVKSRPTFHYRMPSCEIHHEQWGLHRVWNDWVKVEQLAEHAEALQQACQWLRGGDIATADYLHQLKNETLPLLEAHFAKLDTL